MTSESALHARRRPLTESELLAIPWLRLLTEDERARASALGLERFDFLNEKSANVVMLHFPHIAKVRGFNERDSWRKFP